MKQFTAIASFFLGLVSVTINAQQWDNPGVPFRFGSVNDIFADTLHDQLYFCGLSSLNNDNDASDGAMAIYANGQWDTLGIFLGNLSTAIRWHDTLLVTGNFSQINGLPIADIAAFDGVNWTQYGTPINQGGIYRFRIVNNELYAIGAFDFLDGQFCNGIAKRVGSQWQPVGQFPSMINTCNFQDLVKWNGQLYGTGTMRFTGHNEKDIVVLDTVTGIWQPLGPGIQGGFGAGRSLAVFQNGLFVSGSIPINSGNAGHGIMRWDGTQFHPVGTGFQGTNNNYQHLVGATTMMVHNNRLWCSGSFSYAGYTPARGIASWNGYQWCVLPNVPIPSMYLPIHTFAFYQDSLYVTTLEGNFPFNCVRRYVDTNYQDTCSAPVGITELENQSNKLRVHVTDDSNLLLFGSSILKGPYSIYHVSGKLVYTSSILASGDPVEIQLPDLAAGCYVLNTSSSRSRFILP